MARSRWLAFTPRDAILVRDGRPAEAGVNLQSEAVLPTPSTVAGAVGAAYGREPARVRGPVFARSRGGRGGDGPWAVFLAPPADLVADVDEADTIRRLRPAVPEHAVTDLGAALPMLLAGDGEPLVTWLSGAVLQRYLDGTLVDDDGLGEMPPEEDRLSPEEAWRAEPRIGLARDERRTAQEGLLYHAGFLRPEPGVAVLAECDFDEEAGTFDGEAGTGAATVVQFGGRGRLADVAAASGVGWPRRPQRFPAGRVLVYVATPAIWPDPGGDPAIAQWRLPLPRDGGARLVAAAVGPALPVASARPLGSSLVERRLRWAVPPGSVYLLQFDGTAAHAEAAALAWAADTHGKAYGRDAHDRLLTAGFGVVLTGVW